MLVFSISKPLTDFKQTNDFDIHLNQGYHQRSFQKAGGPACWIWVTIPFHAFGNRKTSLLLHSICFFIFGIGRSFKTRSLKKS
jgi:hypothetical protein